MSTRLTPTRAALHALIVIGLGTLAGRSPAQESYAAKTLTRTLKKQKEKYAEAEARAKLDFARYFDRVAAQVRKEPGLPPELKASKLKRIADEKAAYQANGKLPDSSEMLEALFAYEDALHQVRRPLAQTYDRLMNLAIKEGANASLQQLVREKEAFDAAMPGREFFRTGTNWAGSRYTAKSTMRTRMRIGNYEANSFRGQVWQGDAPEDAFIVEGTIDGNFLDFQIVEMVRGAKRLFHYRGYALEKRIVLQLKGIATDGKAIPGDWIQLFLK